MCGLDEAGAGDLLPLTAPTLEAQGASTGQELAREGAVIPIQNDAFGSRSGEASDGRGHPGLGNAQPGSPMYTIDATRPHGVAHSLRPGTHAEHAEGISVPRAARDYKDPILAFRHSASAHDNGVPQEGKAPSLRATDSPVLSVALPGKTCQGDRCIPDDDVWPTLPAQGANNGGGAGAILHRPQAMAVRRLTPRECERLQGFPDDWTSLGDYDDGKGAVEISDTQRYKMCGNSMAVPVMSWLGRRVQLIDGMTTPEAR